MIQLNNIFKWYTIGGTRSYVLKDVNLTIDKGDFVSIMGPSGSGKSSLLHIIGLLDEPNEGQYTFMEEEVLSLKAKKEISSSRLIWDLSFNPTTLLMN